MAILFRAILVVGLMILSAPAAYCAGQPSVSPAAENAPESGMPAHKDGEDGDAEAANGDLVVEDGEEGIRIGSRDPLPASVFTLMHHSHGGNATDSHFKPAAPPPKNSPLL